MSNYALIQEILSSIKGNDSSYRQEVLKDFWICLVSREVSLTGRKEVLSGKAKFGILGDGKELPQVAMARAFEKGDFRSGYYRDQTFMMALDLCSIKQYFAQLYADTINDPFSGGRQMNAHFATPLIDDQGHWNNHINSYNVSSDISSTGGQMARALGLALASKHYRQNKQLRKDFSQFSNKGNEVSFVTIGDASTSEGVFWETMNAAAVQQVPLAVCVWDDGYGISVPIQLQTVKQNISSALSGFEKTNNQEGISIHRVQGWDYPNLVNTFHKGIKMVREEHIPALFHINEVTQPQGHSTSGSHERYKSKERMAWEETHDCIKVFESWIIEKKLIEQDIIEQLKSMAKEFVKSEKNTAWNDFIGQTLNHKQELISILNDLSDLPKANELKNNIESIKNIANFEMIELARQFVFDHVYAGLGSRLTPLKEWLKQRYLDADVKYHRHLLSETNQSATQVKHLPAIYQDSSEEVNGYLILNQYFDHIFNTSPEVLGFGEDVGKIGDVNQGFAGLQDKYGELRIFDTGIREWTIVGQAIGLSMRGLRPIAEIQYLDYIVYALSPLMDDLATVRYRSNGIQKAPVIIRTRGHRLEGIWHSGSPIGMLLHSIRGIHLCVPRNMTQAAGMYQTLLQGDDPGIVIECLNAYRLKEKMPENLGSFTIPLGQIEILKQGSDITLVTYGSCVRIAQKAIQLLERYHIDVELIDVQTLLPFDTDHQIVTSIRKTNKLVVLDEDVPGGASSYILQQILEVQGAYQYLDSKPKTISSAAHRPPYGSDGDYFTKPNAEDVVACIYNIMTEYDPIKYKI